MKLVLDYIPATDDPANDTFFHSDAWGMGQLVALFIYHGTSQEDRRAVIRLRKKFRDAHLARLDSIRIDADQAAVLQRILTTPETVLRPTMKTDTGVDIQVRDLVLDDVRVIAAMENVMLHLANEPGLYDEPEDSGTPPPQFTPAI